MYVIYERLLVNEVSKSNTLNHVAVIQDGNRRYANKLKRSHIEGYECGAETTEKFIDWWVDLKIKHLTLYAFSTENFKRPKEEQDRVFKIIDEKLDKLWKDERTHKNRIRLRAVGEIYRLPEFLKSTIQKMEDATKNYNNFYLNVALAYGGRKEILDAAIAIAKEVKKGLLEAENIDETVISEHLYHANENPIPKVDLIIRTGGDERTSNFLLWQANSNEAAAYFCAPFWPEFRKIDFLRAIRTYQAREHERQKNTVMRVVKMLSYYGKVEVEDVIRISRKFIAIPKDEVVSILHELARHNAVMYNMIKW